MQDYFSRRYNAAKAGLDVMNNQATLWNGFAAISDKVNKIETCLEDIRGLDVETMGVGTAHSERKAALKAIAADLADGITQPLHTYAEDIGDHTLAGEVDLSRTRLGEGKDQDCIDLWTMIFNRATAHLLALTTGGYPIDGPMLTDFETAINDFVTIAGLPKTARTGQKAAREQMLLKFGELKKLIGQVQSLVKPLARTEAKFYGNLMDAFEVIETGVRHYAVRITFIDKGTGVRLKNVLTVLKDEEIFSRRSSELGVVSYKTAELDDGNYSFDFSLKGYVSKKVSGVKVEKGKLVRLEVVMELA